MALKNGKKKESNSGRWGVKGKMTTLKNHRDVFDMSEDFILKTKN